MCEDELELRYKLDASRDAEVLRSGVRGVANGQLHTVSVRRTADFVSLQVSSVCLIKSFNVTHLPGGVNRSLYDE